MDKLFYRQGEGNFFDDLIIDLKKFYEKYPIDRKIDPKLTLAPFIQSPFHKIYRCSLIPLKYRRYFWTLARRVNLDLTWFEAFKSYWSVVLQGRPLWGVQDFFFLKNLYRVKFQDNQVPDTIDPYIHLDAWQRPELIYQLLHLVFKESIVNYGGILSQLYRIKSKVCSLLEFGCGTAPVAVSLFEFYRVSKNLKVYLSDIQTLTFHYGAYRFRQCSNVIPILLRPENDFLLNLDESVDAIFCLSVFEHLNKPFETIKIFHKILKPAGLLFFDYLKSEGDGLDSFQGVRERDKVLDYVNRHFEIFHRTKCNDLSKDIIIARLKG